MRRTWAWRDSHLPALVLPAPPPPQRAHAVIPLPGFEKHRVTWMAFEPFSMLNAQNCHF